MNFFFKVLFLVLICLTNHSKNCHATHIVGGEMNYSYLTAISSNNSACDSLYAYEVIVTIYRDAYNGIPPFDNPLRVKVYDGNNNSIQVFNERGQLQDGFALRSTFVEEIEPMNSEIDSVCTASTVFEQIQVERMRYIDTLFVCKNSSGYQLAYLRCCRNDDILNIVSSDGSPPGETGAVIYAAIPARIKNTNPIIEVDPNILVCINRSLEFSNVAIDLDGDSLVYSFCPSFEACNPNDPFCGDDYFPPFDTVQFTPGYSLENLLGGNSDLLSIDPQTGVVSGVPTVVGQHVLTMCVEEYRDGQYLSETRRDFQFNVLDCSVVTAAFSAERKGCDGDFIPFQFTDKSSDEVGVVQWNWDFGDGTTSIEQNPLHEFAFGQSYDVKMVAFGANGCSDTVIQRIDALELPPLSLADSVAFCGENLVELPLIIEGNNTFVWQPNSDINDNTLQNPVVSPSVPTEYTVTVNTILTPNEVCARTATIVVVPNWPTPAVALGPLNQVQCQRAFDIPIAIENAKDVRWSVVEDFVVSQSIDPNDDVFEVTQEEEETTYYVAASNRFCQDTATVTVQQRGIFSDQDRILLVCDDDTTNVQTEVDLKLNSNDNILQAMVTLRDSSWLTNTGVFDLTLDQSEQLFYEVENLSGCLLIDTLDIILAQNPSIGFVEDTIIVNVAGALNVSVEGDDDLNYIWSPSALFDDARAQFPTANIEESVLLSVVAENGEGCSSSDDLFVELVKLACNESLIVLPSAFTPNGDDKNDVLRLRTAREVKELTLEIYNRWGKKIFSSSDLNATWDGGYEGQLLSTDVFGYVIRATCESGDSFIKKGNVTVIR